MKLRSPLLLLALAIVSRADNPPLEGAPRMEGTNTPHYEHTPGELAPKALHRPMKLVATNSTPDADAIVAQNKAAMSPQVLQSAQPGPTPKVAKPPGIVMYGCYGFSINGTPFWVVPERYLHDLTNHYQFQYAEKIILPEP